MYKSQCIITVSVISWEITLTTLALVNRLILNVKTTSSRQKKKKKTMKKGPYSVLYL